jgi:hypothetical protein
MASIKIPTKLTLCFARKSTPGHVNSRPAEPLNIGPILARGQEHGDTNEDCPAAGNGYREAGSEVSERL